MICHCHKAPGPGAAPPGVWGYIVPPHPPPVSTPLAWPVSKSESVSVARRYCDVLVYLVWLFEQVRCRVCNERGDLLQWMSRVVSWQRPRRLCRTLPCRTLSPRSAHHSLIALSCHCSCLSCNHQLFHLSTINLRLYLSFLPRCMECRRGLVMRILSVRLSVCQTRQLWQNVRKICLDF